jgi:hypothetical protein
VAWEEVVDDDLIFYLDYKKSKGLVGPDSSGNPYGRCSTNKITSPRFYFQRSSVNFVYNR